MSVREYKCLLGQIQLIHLILSVYLITLKFYFVSSHAFDLSLYLCLILRSSIAFIVVTLSIAKFLELAPGPL